MIKPLFGMLMVPPPIQMAPVVKLETFYTHSKVGAEFAARSSKGALTLADNDDVMVYAYIDDGRVYLKRNDLKEWILSHSPEILEAVKLKTITSKHLDFALLDQGSPEPKENPYDVYRRTMQQRREILFNRTEEDVASLNKTHPISNGLGIDREYSQTLAEGYLTERGIPIPSPKKIETHSRRTGPNPAGY